MNLDLDPTFDRETPLEPERYELHEPPRTPFTLDRREFLRALGGGLAVFCVLRSVEAQESGRAGRRGGEGFPDEIAAWLHIDENGSIAAYTGKVEVGQNARTSLTQAVADELRVPVGSVRLVMGDTDRVPFDRGTFGSRTTPTMVPQVRRAAAAARGLLLGLAAENLGVDHGELVVADGRVSHPTTGRSVAFGSLTAGRELVESIGDDAEPTPPDRWTVAGITVPKVDGRDFVTGRHRYASDVSRPDMLRAKILRPPVPNARLATLDMSEAQAMTGVIVVRDGDFIGVAAPDEPTAERGLAVLKAEWTIPADPDTVSDRDVHDHFRANAESDSRSERRRPASLDKVLASAEITIDAQYTVAYIAHAPLEPRAAVAEWRGDRLTVWTGTQRPFGVRSELAQAFGIPEDRIRVLVPDTGSGYGGKHTGEAAIEAARMAKAAGRPVKLTWTREEEFTHAYLRPAGWIEAKAAATRDGKLLAWEFHNVNSGGSGIETPYEVAERFTAFHPVRSPLRQGSYRALAATANHFARESLMDELAHEVGMDPLAFRLRNLGEGRLRDVLEAAAERFGWGRSKSDAVRGFGLACGAEKGGYVATCVEVAIDRSRGRGRVKVERAVIAFECGAVINPDQIENQVSGALVQGLGGALFEQIRFAGGSIRNGKFTRYPLPRFRDTPTVEVVLLDRPERPLAGAGETPIVAIAPAVANAIFAATGKRIRSMPLVPQGLEA